LPFMDDNWYSLLTTIKEKTSKDAILNSWWDFGDWFKAVAARRVIFDGQSQNTPQAYWMAAALLSNNEEEAITILRMLNNGANQAFEIINRNFNDPLRAVMFLKKIISLNNKTARGELWKVLPDADAREVARMLFDRPPEAYFIVDYTLADKMSSISFIGNWDFSKVYLKKNLGKKKKEEMITELVKSGIESKLAERLYNEAKLITEADTEDWLSRRVIFKGDLVRGYPQNNTILFDNGMIYKPWQQRVYLYASYERKYKVPKSLFIFSRARLREISYPGSDLDFSVLILQDKDEYYAVILDRELAKSLLVRLYFFNARGLKHFKPYLENQQQGRTIRVFRINWN